MGVDLKNIHTTEEVIPQCDSCGVCLCWSIDDTEYLMWKNFWEDWTCRDCNPEYKGAYERYKQNNKPFKLTNNL